MVNADLSANITSIYLVGIGLLVQIQTGFLFLNMDPNNVVFDPSNPYSKDLSTRTLIISLVVSQAPEGAVSAVVV